MLGQVGCEHIFLFLFHLGGGSYSVISPLRITAVVETAARSSAFIASPVAVVVLAAAAAATFKAVLKLGSWPSGIATTIVLGMILRRISSSFDREEIKNVFTDQAKVGAGKSFYSWNSCRYVL